MKTAQIAIGVFLSVGGLLLSLGIGVYFVYYGVLDLQAGRTKEGIMKMFVWAELYGLLCVFLMMMPGLILLRRIRIEPPPSSPTPPA
ncbi:hypothetical protein L6R29_09455 [Myxococcota bacterium]|nr:hypothetical protein [Myxococcota bacterium]